MSAPEAYGAFAWAYDPALGERFFGAVLPMLEHVLERHHPAPASHLDVACGSGLALAWSAGEGFRAVGLDASLPMLSLARDRAAALVAGDMRTMPLRGEFGLVTSLYDSLNHLLTVRDLIATFRGVRSLLAPGGCFVFDVNHPAIYPRVWGIAAPYESVAADHELSIATRWSRALARGEARVTGWAMRRGRKVSIDEKRRQRAWSERAIRSALTRAGLTVAERIGFDPFGETADEPAKLLFVARPL
ncbi:MAG TPA: class I SAM-dependent methyltransferase [Thermoanaerobaculia bacterium]|nr:class I SAM-dependent methyltransferase [Thermoanaerobaculia bacterium]